jgi:hypothetical protein
LLSSPDRPAFYCRPGGVLTLSGAGLLEFIKAFLAKRAQFRFRALGFSMYPFIQDGDVITLLPLDGQAPKAGMVVAFCHPQSQKLVVHRLLATLADGCLIRGDSALAVDGVIPLTNILGIVRQVEREGKEVRLGLGPERRLIAWLSQHNLLQSLIHLCLQLLRLAWSRLPR